MEKNELIKYLLMPELQSDIDYRMIKQEAENFPFFQPFQFMLLKYYQANNKFEFDKFLKKSSVHVFDRRRLFNFIHSETYLLENISANETDNLIKLPSLVDESEPEKLQLLTTELAELQENSNVLINNESENQPIEHSFDKTESISQGNSNQILTRTEVEENISSRREEKDTLKESIAEIVEYQSQSNNSDVSENNILPEITFELDENIEIIKPEVSDIEGNTINETYIPNSENDKSFLQIDEGENSNLLENKEQTNSDDVTEIRSEKKGVTIDISEEVPDDSTLFQDSSEKNEESGNAENKKEIHTFTAWFDHLDESEIEQIKSNSEKKNSGNANFDLIDKFLTEEPRIKPKPITASEQEDISVASEEEHEDFMTETLAKIYIKQGNYAKAIKAYEKLSLKFPEKNIYFATQIEEIKKILDNQ
jgi:ribosomal protein S18